MNADFDAIIIGTGMGGGSAGFTLANAGLRVLFLERGLPRSKWNHEFADDYSEGYLDHESLSRSEIYEQSGRSTYKVNSWIPVLGGGEGGSTAVYGAALFPFHPEDLKSWPESNYDALSPYYRRCDELFNPQGSNDPIFPDKRILATPEKLSPSAQELFDFYVAHGLHPFQTPIGFEKQPGCKQCFGHFCPTNCKKTSSNVFIEPALKTGRAQVAYSVVAESLNMNNRKVVGVFCRTPQGPREFKGKWYFVAAGALGSPILLLNSKSPCFLKGVGNNCDLVGRFLMRHLIDFYYVKTPSSHLAQGHLVEVSISDFYYHNQYRWGLLNSTPSLMPPEIMASEFVERLHAQSSVSFPKKLLKPIISAYIQHLTKKRIVITSILEDTPSHENRILPDSTVDDVKTHYLISEEDNGRLQESRRHFKKLFKPLAVHLLKVAEDSSFLAHGCGTCRMDTDFKKGVVDPSGLVFGVENLFVADASIFPTSGGANPSLTVAACAMKIADQFMREKWKN